MHATIGAGQVLIKDDEVLLVKLNYGKAKGGWILPGGMVEREETPQSGAEREVFEETGLRSKTLSPVAVRFRKSEFGMPNLYWVFSGQLPDESLVTLKRMLRWPAGELMETAFVPVEDALKIEEVRPMTRLFLSLEQRRSDLKQMTWINDDMDCIFRFF